MDPLSPEYPELTPYQFASNTPIQAIDLDGLEAWVAIWASSTGQSGHVALVLPEVKKIGPGKFEATGKFVVWDVYGERSNDFQFWVNSPNQKVGGRAQRRVFSYQQITVDTREGGNAKEKNPIYRAAGAPDYILGIDKEASGSFMEAYVIDKELQKLFKNPDISFSLEAPKDGYTGNEDPHKVPFSCGGFVSWAIKKFYGVNSTAEHMLAKESRYLGTTTPAVDMKVFTPKSIFESIYEKATSIEKIEGKRNQRADFILKKPTLDNASDGVVKDLNPQQ